MKRFDTHIIEKLAPVKITGSLPETIAGLTDHSGKVDEGGIFVAVKGPVHDGHDFIDAARSRKPAVIVAEKEVAPPENGAVIIVENSAKALADLAAWYYDYPSEKLKITGVTGTNGKTSVATLLYQVFQGAGYPSGLISTVENKIGTRSLPAVNTTPGVLALNRLLTEMAEEGIEYVFMEVSSHGIDQGRVEGIRFTGGIFTNLTPEHLDYHKTFIEYRDTKKKFFDRLPPEAFALTNKDDKNGLFMLQNTPARKFTYALKNPADFKGEILEKSFEGMLMRINGTEFWTRLTGTFNAYNITAVFGGAVLNGLSPEETALELSRVTPPRGRFELVRSDEGKIAVIDYAHTPDALEKVLKTIVELRKPGQQIITVAGAGGDRDKTKRPEMARKAAALSDWLILTSDNPRTEPPEQILADMLTGIDERMQYKTLVIPDRREAIKAAERYARPGDIILIAGKGHETYQIIGTEKKYFNDKEEIQKQFKRV